MTNTNQQQMKSKKSTSSKSWYLIYTKPRSESIAEENLLSQGYKTYLPLFKKRCTKNLGSKDIIEPLFPRYLFIKLSLVTDNWSPIRSTLGVSSVVNFGFSPAKVPDSLIEELKRNGGNDGIYEFIEKKFVQGQPIEIVSGPMSGQSGVFNDYSTKNRVNILLNLLGKETPVQISREHLNSNDYLLTV